MKLILLIAVILRLIFLNQSLWLDEAIQALALMGKMGPLLTYALADFQPPLYHLILSVWTSIAGYSELALRLPSLAAGVGTVYLTAMIAKKYGGQKLMYLAGLLAATNPLLIYYSQEGRTYGLTAFLVTASFYYFLQLLTKNNTKYFILYTLYTTLFLWTSYLSWFVLLAQGIYALYHKRYDLLRLQALSVITLVLWLPSFLSSLSIGSSTLVTSREWGRVVGGIDWKSLPLTWVKFVIGRISFENNYLYAGIVGLIGSLHLLTLSRLKPRKYPLLLTWLIVPVGLGVVTAIFLPVYQYFRVLFVLPAYLLILALALSRFKSGYLAGSLILLQVAALAYFWLTPSLHRENWRALTSEIPRDATLAMPSRAQSAPLTYYGYERSILEPRLDQLSGDIIYYIRYVEDLFDQERLGEANFARSGYTITREKVYSGIQVDIYENRN